MTPSWSSDSEMVNRSRRLVQVSVVGAALATGCVLLLVQARGAINSRWGYDPQRNWLVELQYREGDFGIEWFSRSDYESRMHAVDPATGARGRWGSSPFRPVAEGYQSFWWRVGITPHLSYGGLAVPVWLLCVGLAGCLFTPYAIISIVGLMRRTGGTGFETVDYRGGDAKSGGAHPLRHSGGGSKGDGTAACT